MLHFGNFIGKVVSILYFWFTQKISLDFDDWFNCSEMEVV